MRYGWPLFLQLLSLIVGVVEALVPSFGVLTAVSLGLMAYSWYYIVTELPAGARLAFGLADLVLVPATVWLSVRLVSRSKLSHSSDLGAGSGLDEVEKQWQALVGEIAVVESQLRPIGKIKVRGEIYEASAGGDLVEKGERVKIVSASGTKLNVEKISPGADSMSAASGTS